MPVPLGLVWSTLRNQLSRRANAESGFGTASVSVAVVFSRGRAGAVSWRAGTRESPLAAASALEFSKNGVATPATNKSPTIAAWSLVISRRWRNELRAPATAGALVNEACAIAAAKPAGAADTAWASSAITKDAAETPTPRRVISVRSTAKARSTALRAASSLIPRSGQQPATVGGRKNEARSHPGSACVTDRWLHPKTEPV